jgi:hypothetical protein
MRILGVTASGFFNGDFELISTTTLGSSAANVTFDVSGLGSTYKHLQIRIAARSTASEVLSGMRVRLGAGSIDTGTNYSGHQLYGYNSAVSSSSLSPANLMPTGAAAGANATANIFGSSIVDILDAFSTTKNKTIRSLGGVAAGTGTNAYVALESGSWYNTSAITQAQVLLTVGSYATGSRFSIYGIKG